MRRLVPQQSKRRRLDSCVCNILMYLLAVALAIGSVAFCATRTHMYHMAFSKRQLQVHNDAWLLQQCRSAEFYSNMKHHSTLCDDAELAKSDAIWLHALRDVIDSTYICGGESCAVTLDRCLQWLLGRGLLTLGAVTFCLFVLLTLSMQLQRTCILRDERTHTAACMLPPRHYPMLVGMDAHGDM